MSTASVDSQLLGSSRVMQCLRALIARVAPSEISVLVTGETGVGKELVAQALHRTSKRVGRFVPANVCAVSEGLFERAMFGHVRGAYTGAAASAPGLVASADKGTLFLDEIGDLRSAIQPCLLRVLETGEYSRVGEEYISRTSDFRLVSATNACLETLVATRRFREDLLYRLRAIQIHVPSLREHREDIPILGAHFATERTTPSKQVRLLSDAVEFLRDQEWPGNVRQLRDVIRAAIALSEDGRLDRCAIEAVHSRPLPSPFLPTRAALLRVQLVESLRRANGDKSEVARERGVHLATVYRWMEKSQVSWPLAEHSGDVHIATDSHIANANSH